MLFQKLQIKTTVSTNTGLRAAFTVPRQALQSLVLEAQLADPGYTWVFRYEVVPGYP